MMKLMETPTMMDRTPFSHYLAMMQTVKVQSDEIK